MVNDKRVADYIIEYLEEQGVDKIFLLAGGGMMHLLDAINNNKKITYICNHHEQASGIAADAYARVSGKIGVCFATSGPGGTNTLTAVVGAFQDSTPVLFVTGQSKLSQTIRGSKIKKLRQFGTFEVDIISAVKPFTKYSAFVDKAEDIKFHLDKALYYAFEGRPGPVFLDIPIDIQGKKIFKDKLKSFNKQKRCLYFKNRKIIKNTKYVVKCLERYKKPLIVAGYGIRASKSVNLFREFIEKYNIPVVVSNFGKDVLEYENKMFIGHLGVKGDRAGNFAVQSADLLISIGCSLHVTSTGYELDKFAPNAFKILIDPDKNVHLRQKVGVNKNIICDINVFLKLLLLFSKKNKLKIDIKNWISVSQNWKKELPVYLEKHKTYLNKINFYQFFEQLEKFLPEDCILVTDSGSSFYVMGQAFRIKKNQRFINSGSLGAMGFALPAATGSSIAKSNKMIICVTGDGSLQTNLHELSVFKRFNLNIKLFIINNDGYVSIRNTQNNFFNGRLVGTSFETGVFIPKTSKIAEAFELKYISTAKLDELENIISEAINYKGPIICEIFTPPFQEIIPMLSSIKLEDGSLESKPLDDMFPFMDKEERAKFINKI